MTGSDTRRNQLLALVTAFLALFASGVAVYGMPRFYPFFVEELGWTRQQVTSGNAYSRIAVAIVFGFIAGRLVDRFGPRRLMLVGIVMAGGALVGLSSATGFSTFYLFYGFNALGWVCGGPLPNQVLLSRWFDRARGKAMGLAYLGFGVGGALVPFIAHSLTDAFGWRIALRLLGGLMILVAFPAAFVVREPAASRERADGAASISFRAVTSRPAFYLLLVGSMASIGAVAGTVQNLALYLSLDRKLPQITVDTMLSLVLVGSLLGRVVMGWLADRWPKRRVMLLIYLIVACSIPPLFIARTPSLIGACALAFGVGLGGDYMIVPLMAAELFGVAVLGRVMGVVLTADSVAEALVPMIVAAIRDRTGSYDDGISCLLVLAIVGAVAVCLLPRRPAERSPASGSPIVVRAPE